MRGPKAMARARSAAAAAVIFCLGSVALAGATEIVQKGDLRVAVDGKMTPTALPRTGIAPVAVSVAGRISTVDKGLPPQLKTLRIEINRHGRLDYTGLPTCTLRQIQPATTAQALSACRSSLVGKGIFSADVVLRGQEPYPSKGRLLVFNGREGNHQVLFGQIYTAQPFTNSFVITFQISPIGRGTFGTALTASLPQSLGNWGYVTGIEMTLSRRYSYRGAQHSYISAGCPAPKGFSKASFSLAKASFGFEGGKKLSSTMVRTCTAR